MEFISVPADMLELTEDPLGPILHFLPIDVRPTCSERFEFLFGQKDCARIRNDILMDP